MKRVRALLALSALGVAGIAGTGCSDVQSDFCAEVCKCQTCGEKGQERCDVGVQGEFDIAETYGCLELAEIYVECLTTNTECTADKQFVPDVESCQGAFNDYEACKQDSSNRADGPY